MPYTLKWLEAVDPGTALVCPRCRHTITDPVVILAARRWKAWDGAIALACVACQRAGRGDQVLEEEVHEHLVHEDLDVSDCICRHHCHLPRLDGTCCLCHAPLHSADLCTVCARERQP